MNDGKTYQEISKFLNIAYPTAAYWAVHGDPDNLESFLDGRREGNFHKITKEYEELLLKTIDKEPAEYGYGSMSGLHEGSRGEMKTESLLAGIVR